MPNLVTGSPTRPAGRPQRGVVVALLVLVLVVAALAALIIRGGEGAERPAVAAAPLQTVPVTTGDMVSATNARATLHYAQEAPLAAAAGGVLTAVPPVGTVISPGGTLYRINNVPVVLMRGALPAWRSFEAGMDAGEDVRQLEENLSAFGVFRGDVDAAFTKGTAAAVRAWQKALGVEQTGRIDRTAVLFADHDLRVARSTAALGAEAGPGTELYRVSSTSKVVDLDLRLTDQKLAVVGSEVGITLPDGTTTTGSIAAVGEPLEREAADTAEETSDGSYVVPVTVTVADQAAVAGFPRASVMVQFSSTLADGVLTVPVESLVAIDAKTFAVQTPGAAADEAARTVPVTVGAFASGRVEISGKGIREGLPVVVPAS